jgi:DNA repair protein RecO
MSSFKTAAIVLHKRPLWEADRLYVLYTPAFGKIEAQVKSAVKTSSKLAGGLEPVSLVEVMVIRGKSREIIAGVGLKKRFNFKDQEIFDQVNLVRELFLKLIKPAVSEPELYDKLIDYFNFLEGDSSVFIKRFSSQRFIWQMLRLLGHVSVEQGEEHELLKACLSAEPASLQVSHNLLQELEKITKKYLINILESDLNSLSYA